MSRSLTAREICERALRQINAYPITESAPDGEQLREALFWLDLIMAEIAGEGHLFWLKTDLLTLDLEPGVASYRLSATMGAEFPLDGVQFPIEAFLEDDAGRRSPITIVRRDTFQDVRDAAEPGVPTMVYIDRLASPTLFVHPVIPTGTATAYKILLVVQTYAPNVAPSGVSGNRPQGSALTGFRQAWQRYLIYRLAFDLGTGPIHKLSNSSLQVFKREIEEAKAALEAFENQEHDTEDPVVHPRY